MQICSFIMWIFQTPMESKEDEISEEASRVAIIEKTVKCARKKPIYQANRMKKIFEEFKQAGLLNSYIGESTSFTQLL